MPTTSPASSPRRTSLRWPPRPSSPWTWLDCLMNTPHRPHLQAHAGGDRASSSCSIIRDYYPVAPGVVLIRAPGHSTDSQMVYVRLQSGREILHSVDAAWNLDNMLQLKAQGGAVGEGGRAGRHGPVALAEADARERAATSPSWSPMTTNCSTRVTTSGIDRRRACAVTPPTTTNGFGRRRYATLAEQTYRVARSPWRRRTASAQAQGYPTRSITVVVPFPAGGPSDVVARIVTERDGQVARPDDGDRERRRRRRHDRQRARGRRDAGRLHAARRQHGIARLGAGAHAQHQVRLASATSSRSASPRTRPP